MTSKGVYQNEMKPYCTYYSTNSGSSKLFAALYQDDRSISGSITSDNALYSFIAPYQRHLWYPLTKQSPQLAVGQCGIKDHQHNDLNLARRKRDIDIGYDVDTPMDYYTEVFTFIDYSMFLKYGSIRSVATRIIQVMSYANAWYREFGIHLILVGMEIWDDKQHIIPSSDSATTLERFLTYKLSRKINVRYDIAHFFTNQQFDSDVIGLAFIGMMCNFDNGISLASDYLHSTLGTPLALSWTTTHEIGHNFGLSHDTPSCQCSTSSCIMAAKLPSSYYLPTWSSCSKFKLPNYVNSTAVGFCLHDLPKSTNFYGQSNSQSYCGNGIIETGEQCDCGPGEFCKDNCCNGATCMLKKSAVCATGKCCDRLTCSYKASGVLCRSISDECDLPEYCNGYTEKCPVDYFKINGTQCYNGNGYCVNGECGSANKQCSKLFGEPVYNSIAECYTQNMNGNDEDGYCGYTFPTNQTLQYLYQACNISDIYCGTLQCNPISGIILFPYAAYNVTTINNSLCAHVRHNMQQAATKDPGLAQDGTPCGHNSICLNSTCQLLTSLVTIPCGYKNCGLKGVCNNIGDCFCNAGYLPPDCVQLSNTTCGGSLSGGVCANVKEFYNSQTSNFTNCAQTHTITSFNIAKLFWTTTFIICALKNAVTLIES